MEWRIWYADESTFSSEDGDPADAPMDGVQIIIDFHDDGNRTIHQNEYYRWMGDSWAAGGQRDIDRWLRLREPMIIMFGLVLSNTAYRKITEAALECRCDD